MNQEENRRARSGVEDEFEFIEIEEFKTSVPRNRQADVQQEKIRSRQSYLIAAGFFLWLAAVFLLGIFVCRIPVITVCLLLLLELVIAVCLHGVPLWIHGAEMLIGLASGAVFGQIFFMAAAALVYLAAVLALHVWKG